MKLRPLNENVVLKKEKVEQVTASGIILSEGTKEEPKYASVVAVGEGLLVDGKRVPLNVKVGDKVVFKQYSTTEFELDDETYLIIKESDILAIVE